MRPAASSARSLQHPGLALQVGDIHQFEPQARLQGEDHRTGFLLGGVLPRAQHLVVRDRRVGVPGQQVRRIVALLVPLAEGQRAGDHPGVRTGMRPEQVEKVLLEHLLAVLAVGVHGLLRAVVRGEQHVPLHPVRIARGLAVLEDHLDNGVGEVAQEQQSADCAVTGLQLYLQGQGRVVTVALGAVVLERCVDERLEPVLDVLSVDLGDHIAGEGEVLVGQFGVGVQFAVLVVADDAHPVSAG